MKQLTFTFFLFFTFSLQAQITFTNASSSLENSGLRSGVAMGVCDMNNDGLDDVIRLHAASDLEIEYQQYDGSFQLFTFGDLGSGGEWGLAVADVDQNGYCDIIAGGNHNDLKLITANSDGTNYSSLDITDPQVFLQSVNFADIDNDGSIDIFACHDVGLSAPFKNDGNGNFTHDLGLISAESTIPSDNSGNYGSIWTDYDQDGDLDLYISKCRQGVSNPMDGRRINLMFENDGSNNYTDVAEDIGLRPLAQSWAAAFEDLDNDGDLDCFIINHDKDSEIYRNDNNVFTQVNASAQIESYVGNFSGGIQVTMEDFDNDTYVDILLTSLSDVHYLLLNNGDFTFTNVTATLPTNNNGMQSSAVGDLNNDGFLDILAGFANGFNSPSSIPDRVLINDGNDNNYIKIKLAGTTSNLDGIGAAIDVHINDTKQLREVRSGESYGNMNSLITHFGLGASEVIDSVVVRWPSGMVDVIENPTVNSTLFIEEGGSCFGYQFTANYEVCEGEGILINGTMVFDAGTYVEELTTVTGCDSIIISTLVVKVINADIFYNEPTAVLATSVFGATYQWVDCGTGLDIPGATNQSYDVIANGSYAVDVTLVGCTERSDCYDVFNVAIQDSPLSQQIAAYPNPTTDFVSMDLGQVYTDLRVEILNIHGQVVSQTLFNNQSMIEIDMTQLNSGIYFARIHADGEEGLMKLIKQ